MSLGGVSYSARFGVCPTCLLVERLGENCGCGLVFTLVRRDHAHYYSFVTAVDLEKRRHLRARRLTMSLL